MIVTRFLAPVAAVLALHLAAALAAEVRIPLTIDYLTLTEALRQELYVAPGSRAPLWNGADACQFLYAESPSFARAAARVSFETSAHLGLGVRVAARCVSPIAWNGIVRIESAAYVAPGPRLMMRIQEMNLYDPQGKRSLLVEQGFDLIKQHLIPRIEAFSYDLNPAIQQLGGLAENASTPMIADRIRSAVATLRAEPEAVALDDGVRITLLMTLPDMPTVVESPPPGAPTAEQIQAFQQRLDQWDAFLVFAIKELGSTVGDRPFRDQLLQILLESRFGLVDALRQPPPGASGPDPLRSLFLDTWHRLGVAVRSAAGRGQLGSRTLRFLSFISAGDALFALDQAAPALGIRVSAADLRRLVHIMAPDAKGDPLEYNFDEDPGLQKLFERLEPLSSPADPASDPSPDPFPASVPSSPTPLPSEPEPAPTPERTPPSVVPPAPSPPVSPSDGSSSWVRFALWLIEPREARAAEPDHLIPQLKKLAVELRRIVVDEDNAPHYRSAMQRLLRLSAERQLRDSELDSRYGATYRLIVESVAWQESCWRQFVRRAGRVTWLESSTGDIGLMQVNKYVWRGFYSIEKLKWDVLYNAGAGAQILMDINRRLVARPRANPRRLEGVALARSVYAAYNGGPDAADRWRRGNEASPGHRSDSAFLAKYRAVQRGDSMDILSCAVDWGRGARQ